MKQLRLREEPIEALLQLVLIAGSGLCNVNVYFKLGEKNRDRNKLLLQVCNIFSGFCFVFSHYSEFSLKYCNTEALEDEKIKQNGDGEINIHNGERE